jgi:hypothetical protein
VTLRRKLELLDAEPPARQAVLDGLRAKMGELLGSGAPSALTPEPLVPAADPEGAPCEPSATSLPFVRLETEFGTLYRRIETLPPSCHVGRMPVDAALGANPDVLALLALDPSLAALPVRGALFLDTETTGLGGAGTLAFLVGLAYFDDGDRLTVEQLLLRSPADEPALLHAVIERVRASTLLVSYNGKAFDWPLLLTRFVMTRIEAPPALPHLDLLHVGRRLHRRRLGACRLKSLEAEVLGFVRGPDVEGADIAARYAHFLRTGDEETLRAIVEHNLLDVLSMAALVGLYGEPFSALHTEDLVDLARTLKRAGALEQAHAAAAKAVADGGGHHALRARGDIAKARGDRAAALSDFEALAASVDDPTVRLELAKLYEHHVREPLKALELVVQGTGEDEAALARRRQRLQRKAERHVERHVERDTSGTARSRRR